MRRITAILFLSLVVPIFTGALLAKTYSISGVVVDLEGAKLGNVEVVLLDADGEEIDKTSTAKRFGKGKFEFKKLESGKYSVEASKEEIGSASQGITIDEDDVKIELTLGAKAEKRQEEVAAEEGEPERAPQEEYVMTEVAFEIKKMTAELDHLGSQMRDLQARSEMWTNPLSIYAKEIILDNGSTVFGKVVYQDEEILKVETLIGYLVIDRSQVVRIIENVAGAEEPEYVPEQIRESYSPPPMPKLAEPRYVSADPSERMASKERGANIVLVGNISEKKDRSNNITFAGQTKNIGGRRADFVKINFVFRKDWSGATKTLTTFVSGAYHTFDSGITTDSSLLPGASGSFEMIVPADFGSFIGYSYTIDWEEYE